MKRVTDKHEKERSPKEEEEEDDREIWDKTVNKRSSSSAIVLLGGRKSTPPYGQPTEALFLHAKTTSTFALPFFFRYCQEYAIFVNWLASDIGNMRFPEKRSLLLTAHVSIRAPA